MSDSTELDLNLTQFNGPPHDDKNENTVGSSFVLKITYVNYDIPLY